MLGSRDAKGYSWREEQLAFVEHFSYIYRFDRLFGLLGIYRFRYRAGLDSFKLAYKIISIIFYCYQLIES